MALFTNRINLVRKTALNAFNVHQKLVFNGIQNRRLVSTTVCRMTVNNESNTPITVQEIHNRFATLMGIEKGYKLIPASRDHLHEYLPKSRDELEPRSMQDSYTTAIIPLSTDTELQDKYISFLGHVRLGRLLEDMDIFAVWVVEKHIRYPKHKPGIPMPYTLVTVLVDKIDFTGIRPMPNEDIRLSGHVSWVGSSSIEVVVWLEQKQHEKWQKITRALFVMAARDSSNRGPAFINPIEPANEDEKKIFSGGLARKQRRLLNKNKSLRKVIPTDIEQKIIHDMFLRTMPIDEVSLTKRVLPQNCQWMETCTLSNIIFSHPENRNLHNKVFGGFIMRQAHELSWVLAYLFAKHRPELKHISDINFHKPIDVNSLIRMTAHVVYTQMQYVQISVYAETFSSADGDLSTTNEFHFTYKLSQVAPEVLPKTYHEAMMYLDGKRHFLEALSDKNQVEDSSLTSKL